MNIKEVWNSSENEVWKRALSEASKDTGRDDLIETKMSKLNVEYLKKMRTREFYNFLYNDYFLWKHIDKRWLENVRKLFKKKYDHNLEELAQIQKDIFEFDLDNINLGLRRATQIYGVGISGASVYYLCCILVILELLTSGLWKHYVQRMSIKTI